MPMGTAARETSLRRPSTVGPPRDPARAANAMRAASHDGVGVDGGARNIAEGNVVSVANTGGNGGHAHAFTHMHTPTHTHRITPGIHFVLLFNDLLFPGTHFCITLQ